MRYHELVEERRPWRRYHNRETGSCSVITEDGPIEAYFEVGTVTTGRSQVFVGTFVRVTTPDGQSHLSEDPYSYVKALAALDLHLFKSGWILNAIGTDSRFYQTGLTDGSTWGYHPDRDKAVHIFAPTLDDLGWNLRKGK